MATWKTWMHRPSLKLGFKRRDSTCGAALTNHMAGEDDGDAAYEAADERLALSVNACVESLPADQRLAVHVLYGLSSAAAWRFAFPGRDRDVVEKAALEALRVLVERRC